jgi:hypothetical protein
MSGDIEKLAVFDARIVQSRPKYAVEKGALSLTNAPFNAIAATTSQHTYNIYVPSENVYVDRGLLWSSDCFMGMTANLAAVGLQPLNTPLVQAGRDFALRSFPLNALCSTLTATINDTTSVINTQDVLNEVLRLTDYKKNRLQRTCPTMLDKYASYDDAFGAVNNPIGGYETSADFSEVPNGAYYDLEYTTSNGTLLSTLANGTLVVNGVAGVVGPPVPVVGGNGYVVFNGIPCSDGVNAGPYSIFIKWRSTEKLVLSPFTFSDVHEWDTGLFGINNIQLVMNLRSDPSRTIRSTSRYGRAISGVSYNTGTTTFQNSIVNVQFLTPSLDVPLPPKSVVPYMEFPRYISTFQNSPIPAGASVQLQSQTITLPQIPDLFIIYCKGSAGVTGANVGSTDADFLLPIDVSQRAPLSVNFDNFSGLLSSHTPQELYAMSVKNGLDMDFNTWAGIAHSNAAGQLGSASTTAGRIPLVGGPLVLKPSQDITLQTGQAPSLVGNFTFQFNVQVRNFTSQQQTPQLFVITANSGFFESIRGSSRIIKGVLSEQDIISAPLAPMGTRDQLDRMVGGAGMFGSLANILSKAKDVYSATSPYHGQIADAAKAAMGAVRGKAMSGGAMTGGAASGGRARLSARLM